ncbi:hypothetical protein G6708_07985 [Polynucleobacter paneuropaeus]|nr:hypothetical protein [Polynucleobacter paneuropaeus]
MDIYIPHYLSNASIGKIIFDPICELDLTRMNFRGRELGSFFNYLDIQILLIEFKLGIPLLLSVINYLAILGIAWVSVYATKIIMPNQVNITYLVIIMLLSSPPIVFSGILYRTNKIIASLGLSIALAFLIIRVICKRKDTHNPNNYLSLPIIFISSCMACLSDEQGLIFLILIGLNLIAITWLYKLNLKYELITIILAVFTYTIYINYLGLNLFQYFNNLTPIKPTLHLGDLINYSNLRESLILLFRFINYLFGNLYVYGLYGNIITIIIFILANIFIIKKLPKDKIKNIYIIFILNIIYILFVIHVMTIKHNAIFWKDIVTYYCLPITILIYLVFNTIVNYFYNIRILNFKNICSILFAIIVLNLSSLNFYDQLIVNGHLKYFRSANLIIRAVYLDDLESHKMINHIRIKETVSGLIPGTKYGENSIIALRKALQINF